LFSADELPTGAASTLMSIPFYVEKGMFQPDYIQVAFASESDPAEITLSKASGEEIQKVALKALTYARHQTFSMLRPVSGPGFLQLPGEGAYRLSLRVRGEEAGRLDFSAKVEKTGDQFSPKTYWRLSGPWTKYGMLSRRPDRELEPMRLWFWGDCAEFGGKTAPITVSLSHAGKEIAVGNGHLEVNRQGWNRYYTDLRVDRNNMFYIKDLLAKSGATTIKVMAAGKPYRTFKVDVSGGSIKVPGESSTSFKPNYAQLLPRVIDPNDRSFNMLETYWLKAQ